MGWEAHVSLQRVGQDYTRSRNAGISPRENSWARDSVAFIAPDAATRTVDMRPGAGWHDSFCGFAKAMTHRSRKTEASADSLMEVEAFPYIGFEELGSDDPVQSGRFL